MPTATGAASADDDLDAAPTTDGGDRRPRSTWRRRSTAARSCRPASRATSSSTGAQIQLTFDGANIAAAGGCNQIASTWSLEGDVLVVAQPAMTMMACEPAALMDQDTWLAAVLTSRPTVTRRR